MKTAALKKLVTEQLNSVPNSGKTFFRTAPDTVSFPYKTFDFLTMALGDLHRDDIDLCVDIWDSGKNPKNVERIADDIENLFNAANLPQAEILPAFFRESRYPVIDSDKLIQHIQLHFSVQNYVRN